MRAPWSGSSAVKQAQRFQDSRQERAAWALILLLASLLRFYHINVPTLWEDEAFTALISVRSPAAIWFYMGHDVHPPLYFLLLHAWVSLFGDSVLAIRAMSACAGIACVALVMWLMRLISTPRIAMLAGLFVALFPMAVRYSQEARMYSLQAVWLLGATLALVYWVKNTRDRYLVIYVVLMTAALYTNYLSFLCAVSHAVYLLVLRCQRDKSLHLLFRPNVWLVFIAITVLYIPWLIGLVDEVFNNTEKLKIGGEVIWIPGLTVYTLPSALWRFFTLRNREEFSATYYLLLPVGVMALSLWAAFTQRSRLKFESMIFIYTFLPIAAIFLVSFVFPLFIERYMSFATLGLPMLFAWGIGKIALRHKRLAWPLAVLIVVVQLAGLTTLYAQQEDLDDERNVENYPLHNIVSGINQRAIAGDQIIVDGEFWFFTVAYYSRFGISPMLFQAPWDKTTDNRPNGYGLTTLYYQDIDQYFIEDLAKLPVTVKRVWWVTDTHLANEEKKYPDNWQCLFADDVAKMEVRLYVIHPSAVNDRACSATRGY